MATCALLVLVVGSATATLVPEGSVRGWLTLPQMEEALHKFAAAYPSLVKPPVEIGESVGGRKLLAVCVGACDDPTASELLITGMHHAREPLGMHAALTFTDWLLSAVSITGNTAMIAHLARTAVWIVPCVNPDGYQYNMDHFPGHIMARKNGRHTCSSADGEKQVRCTVVKSSSQSSESTPRASGRISMPMLLWTNAGCRLESKLRL
jgi:murein tripeptide amidase MpaA